MSKFCITLICPREVEEKLLDALLMLAGDEVFTSTPTFSHGTAQGRLSNLEKVLGRSRSVQVQLIATDGELRQLTQVLVQQFKGTGLRYWASALAFEGEVA